MEHNFNIYNDQVSDSLNVPYDYTSVMHYSKTAFQNGTEPTIVTRISDFMDVIGQRMDFSENDLLKLNQLYNCCMWWVLWNDFCFSLLYRENYILCHFAEHHYIFWNYRSLIFRKKSRIATKFQFQTWKQQFSSHTIWPLELKSNWIL